MIKLLYCTKDLLVPNTRNTNIDVETPGIKSRISVMQPEIEKSGDDDLASFRKLLAEDKVNRIKTTSRTLKELADLPNML